MNGWVATKGGIVIGHWGSLRAFKKELSQERPWLHAPRFTRQTGKGR